MMRKKDTVIKDLEDGTYSHYMETIYMKVGTVVSYWRKKKQANRANKNV